MAATQITLVIDRQNRVLVQSGASVAQLPALSQRDAVALLIQIADPATGVGSAVNILATDDISTGSLRVTVSQKATGTAGDENEWLLAKLREADFTWDAAQSGFTAVLNLNTVQMQNYIAAAESCQAEFEVRYSKGGALSTLLPGPKNKVTIWANDDEGADVAVDILLGVPTFTLPVQFRDPASGELYALTRTAPGMVAFDLVP
jgi:hypothetical protein